MSVTSAFIIYLTLFRLAIIGAGVISIVLGYRLFVEGVWPQVQGGQGATVDARIAGTTFTLKNAAPGTCFALFGVFIIATMFATGSPSLMLDTLNNPGSLEEGARTEELLSGRLRLRGGDGESLNAIIRRGDDYAERQESDKAMTAYQDALIIMATPMNHMAWYLLQQEKLEEALPLSRLAVQLRPDEANFLDTLAEILFRRGEYPEALRLIEKAVSRDSQYKDKLPRFQREVR